MQNKRLIAGIWVVVAILLGVGSYFALSDGESAKMTLSPSEGPSGKISDITITEAELFEKMILNFEISQKPVTADKDGRAETTHTFQGLDNEKITVEALDEANRTIATAVFTILGPGGTTTIPDPAGPLDVKVTISPDSGPSGGKRKRLPCRPALRASQ